MSKLNSAKDYPEHLNPFDDNYNGVEVEEPCQSRQKYNTWSARGKNQLTLSKPKPTFLEKPWAALNLTPKGKIVRRLSILKTAVERFASKKKNQLAHSSSFTDSRLPPRSHSVHDDFKFRIVSPKVKERLRQQVFSKSPADLEQSQEPGVDEPQPNGRLSPNLNTEGTNSLKNEVPSPSSPEVEKQFGTLGARPRTRKKRPPPPPPPPPAPPSPNNTTKSADYTSSSGTDKPDDSRSNSSSITQDLEKDVNSEEEHSLTEPRL